MLVSNMKIELLRDGDLGNSERLASVLDGVVEEKAVWQWMLALDENGCLILRKNGSDEVIIIDA